LNSKYYQLESVLTYGNYDATAGGLSTMGRTGSFVARRAALCDKQKLPVGIVGHFSLVRFFCASKRNEHKNRFKESNKTTIAPIEQFSESGTGEAMKSSSTATKKTISFPPYSSNTGYIVGANKTVLTFTINPVFSITSLSSPSGSSFNFNPIHVFQDGSFMAGGTSGKVYYYNQGQWIAQSGLPSVTINDIYFTDDRVGYIAGNNGALYKCTAPQNIETFTTSVSWQPEPVSDLFGINSSDSAQLNIDVIAFPVPNSGFVGGYLNNGIAPDPGYARLVRDESQQYSTLYWYDVLGRLIASQNTKQFSMNPPAYSYTLYDPLGRITEVGQKSENSSGTKFNNIFGYYVNGIYNPRVINDSIFNTWVSNSNGARTEVTHTYYDTVITSTGLPVKQQNLRKRVSSVTYSDIYHSNPLVYNYATHYDYDIHGNVDTLLQDNYSVTVSSQRFKKIAYCYDLVSGNMNGVYYQPGQPDRFYQTYEYDADNRLTDVNSSKDSVNWDRDAHYIYYLHGPLARVEIGNNNVQGIDYAYTLQGWIKGINSDKLDTTYDIGKDGALASLNKSFATDAFGYSLDYFNGDYTPIGGSAFTAGTTNSDLMAARHDLYNGNITAMATTITQPASGVPNVLPQAMAYNYDQLNRLISARAYSNLIADSNKWGGGSVYTGKYNNAFTYDGNGNILTALAKDQSGTTIDQQTYGYQTLNGRLERNRLYAINDAAGSTSGDDIPGGQTTFTNTPTTGTVSVNTANNYGYDAIGELTRDNQDSIASITWTVSGKIKSVTRISGSSKYNLTFDYDANQKRIAKHVYLSNGTWVKTEYYVRDAKGNTMAVYENKDSASTAQYILREKDIYGSSEIGTENTPLEMIGVSALPTTNVLYAHSLGYKHYTGSNHLGNVLTTFSDAKVASRPCSDLTFDGSNDYVQIPFDSLLDFGTGDFTIEVWVKATTPSSTYPSILSNRTSGDLYHGYVLFNYASQVYIRIANNTWSIASINIVDGNWHHIAVTRNGTTLDGYIDGTMTFTTTDPSDMSNNNVTWIGADQANFAITQYAGQIDEVRFWNIARSGSDINTYKNTRLTGSESGLVSYYRFNEDFGQTVSDATGNGINGFLGSTPHKDSNDPTWTNSGQVCDTSSFSLKTLRADVLSSNDYQPFGGFMTGRTFDRDIFPNSFNGKRDDNELNSWQDYGDRMYDKWMRKFPTVDPLFKKYPWYTPYQFAGNKPIRYVDRDGDEEEEVGLETGGGGGESVEGAPPSGGGAGGGNIYGSAGSSGYTSSGGGANGGATYQNGTIPEGTRQIGAPQNLQTGTVQNVGEGSMLKENIESTADFTTSPNLTQIVQGVFLTGGSIAAYIKLAEVNDGTSEVSPDLPKNDPNANAGGFKDAKVSVPLGGNPPQQSVPSGVPAYAPQQYQQQAPGITVPYAPQTQ